MPASELLPPPPPVRQTASRPAVGPPAAPGSGEAGRRSVRAALRYAAPALLAYSGVRALGLLVLAGWAAAADRDAYRLLSARWDSLWYARIAEDGYGHTARAANGDLHPDLAFFPLLPALERALSAVTPLDAAGAGVAVSALASLCAAAALFAIGDRLYGRSAGITLAVLWAALPVGIVQSMAYSESLFTALAAWALYALLTGRWVWAGTLAALAGLTRPVGAAVVAAVWIAAAGRLRRERRLPASAVAGVLLAPLGWLGYVGWVGARTGSPAGYLDVQAQWGNGFDGGAAFAAFVWDRLTGAPAGGVALLAGVGLVVWLCVWCVRQRQPPPLLAYAGTVVVLALCARGYFGSKPRLLLPAFPLLLPLAVALTRLRPAATAAVLATAALGSAVYGAFWLHGSGPP
ncbi:mannosyltransferase family protein [Streptomyces sp. TRM 70361]|uniref:mannosyltransferase family protein n=1 Tax=Streptomyces sp. TRM 70361 TaxID=3116553 RepID=UPI002E7C129E|nr:mannosyltransferase family protein [Streptomyces sp. TRM 70361]MEE1942729.1 mannosyltransferase family protein [Streptomyces sp. TRM 70361]